MFQTKILEKIKTHFIMFNTYFYEIMPLWNNVEKHITA